MISMYNKCGIRKADEEAVLELFNHSIERYEKNTHQSDLERYIHEKLIWDCFGHDIMYLSRTKKV